MEKDVEKFKELLGEYKNNIYRACKIDLTHQINKETNIKYEKSVDEVLKSENDLIKMYEEVIEELNTLRKFREEALLKRGEFLK